MSPRGARTARDCSVYWGWVVVGVCVVCSSLGHHIGSLHINVLTMSRVYATFFELGYPRSAVSIGWLVGTLSAAVATPIFGKAIDRFGARICMPLALMTMSVGMMVLSQATSIYVLPCAFFLMRGAALGAIAPFVMTVINQWFLVSRGKAVATYGICANLISSVLMGSVFQSLMDRWGWRHAHLWLAAVPLIPAALSAVVMCHTPESVGLRQDGAENGSNVDGEGAEPGMDDDRKALLDTSSDSDDDSAADEKGGDKLEPAAVRRQEEEKCEEEEEEEAAHGGAYSFTLREALHTVPLWLLSIDKFFAATIGAGCSQTLVDVLRENGASGVDIAKHVMLPNGVAQATLPLIVGMLRDHGVPARYMVALSSFLIACAPFTAAHIQGPGLAVVFGLNFGSVWGLKATMAGFLYGDFYGRKHLGSIQSIDQMCGLVGTAVGPLFVQLGREMVGDYTSVLYLLTVMPAVCAMAMLVLLKPPRQPRQHKMRTMYSS